MPIYEYEPVDGNCSVCRGRFELRRPIDREELTSCPLCKKPVRKIPSSVHTPSITKPMSTVDAKKAGFTIFEKRDEGVYERL